MNSVVLTLNLCDADDNYMQLNNKYIYNNDEFKLGTSRTDLFWGTKYISTKKFKWSTSFTNFINVKNTSTDSETAYKLYFGIHDESNLDCGDNLCDSGLKYWVSTSPNPKDYPWGCTLREVPPHYNPNPFLCKFDEYGVSLSLIYDPDEKTPMIYVTDIDPGLISRWPFSCMS